MTETYLSYSPNGDGYLMQPVGPTTLQITSAFGNTVMTISSDGKVIWHDESKADEAASILIRQMSMRVEDLAGIRYRRDEWENDIKAELSRVAQTRELTPDVIEEVFAKHKMLSHLKGKA